MTLSVDLDLSDPPVRRSSSSSGQTSTARRPRRASSVRIAKSRTPTRRERSHDSSMRSIAGCAGNWGTPASRQRPTDGTASARPGFDETPHAQIPQQLAQLVRVAAHRSRPHRVDSPQQESGHIGAGEALDPELILGRDSFCEKPICQPRIAADGRQATAPARQPASPGTRQRTRQAASAVSLARTGPHPRSQILQQRHHARCRQVPVLST